MSFNQTIRTALMVIILSCANERGFSQGTFVNLNFESARIILDTSSPYYPYAINVTNAVPGWTVTEGVFGPDILYNTVSTGSPAVSLQGPGSHLPILQGNYSVLLQGSTGGAPTGASIEQTGQILANSESLRFYGDAAYIGNF